MAEADPPELKTVDLETADLAALLARAAAGEEMLLAKAGKSWVRLSPPGADAPDVAGERPLGGLGYELPASFLAPMTDAELADWGL